MFFRRIQMQIQDLLSTILLPVLLRRSVQSKGATLPEGWVGVRAALNNIRPGNADRIVATAITRGSSVQTAPSQPVNANIIVSIMLNAKL